MSSNRNSNKLRETIPFEDSALLEFDEDGDELLAESPALRQEATVARPFPRGNVHQAQTRSLQGWDVAPPGADAPHTEASTRAAVPVRDIGPRPHDEVTAVRKREEAGAHWIDLHAVVGADGVLRLPEDVARRLHPGAIVELRLAAWAVED